MNLGNLDIIRWHLEHGAGHNIQTRSGYTALDHAAYHHALKTVQLLINHGADINTSQAIHGAVANSPKLNESSTGRLEIVEYLLDRGADINQLESAHNQQYRPVTYYTGTPLHRAVESEKSENVSFLLSRGADRKLKGVMGLTPLEVAERDSLDEIAGILRTG